MHYKRWRKHGDPLVTTVKPRTGTCSVDGCVRAVDGARGFCEMHYQRWKTHGDPTITKKGGPKPPPLISRRVIDPVTGCWEYVGTRGRGDYGRVKYNGRLVRVHRLAAHLWLGFDLDSPQSILHSCDNPPCFNPAHLRPGSKAENARDMVERGRHVPVTISGEAHWNAKLSEGGRQRDP
jgi:hypothetical protein